jgi:hypothetical protein
LRHPERENAGNVQSSQKFRLGLASQLALFLVADIVVFFVFTGLAISSGGSPIGAGLLGIFLLVPAPFLVVALIAVVAHSLLKRK